MGRIFITGDIHCDPYQRFSFTRNPQMKELREDDVVFILGDFGILWDQKETAREKSDMEWLASKPWTTIAITGNHENYDRILALLKVERFGGEVRDSGYENIIIVSDATILDVNGFHILCLPRAESHDIYPVSAEADFYHLGTGYSNLVDGSDKNWKRKARKLWQDGLFYRVSGYSWWPQEKIPIREYEEYVAPHEDEYFDFVLSHEAPGSINQWFGRGEASNKGQSYFELLARCLNYKYWLHGHFHFDGMWPTKPNFRGVYQDLLCFSK